MPAITGLAAWGVAVGSRWLGKGCACVPGGGARGIPEGKSLALLAAGGRARGLLAFLDLRAAKKGTRCETPCGTLPAVPAGSLWFWLVAFVSGVFGSHCKGKAFVQPTGLILHCRHGEHCLCKCSSPAWKQSLSNWVTIAETHHLCIWVRALTKAVKAKLLSGGGVAVTPLRHCLCMGFSSPLAPFNLLFGKTTQCSSPLCVSISSYLNFLQRLLKATGGPGKHPGSACTLAACRRCCRYSTKRRRTSSHAPQPLRGARPHAQRTTAGGAWQGSSMPSLHPSPVAVWLGSATTNGARLALKVGECNQLQKSSPLFPTGSSKSGWQTKENAVTSESC